MNLDDITLCLTIGKRPKELEQSLSSLLSFLPFRHIIAVNDFGDDMTNNVFSKLCPHGTLVSLGHHQGHHQVVDLMYNKVDTPYIFHSEDDWLFDACPNINFAKKLLDEPLISSVIFRKIPDFIYDEQDRQQANIIHTAHGDYVRLDGLHEQWHGYSFNPHLAKKSLWQAYSPFSRFKKERHISRHLRKQGLHIAYLEHGVCHHIGHDSVANPPKSFWQKLMGR